MSEERTNCLEPYGSREWAAAKAHGLNNDPSEAMRWLEQMTPGGSEFHDDPENCFYHVMRERYERWEIIKKQQRRIRELERLLSQNNQMMDASHG